MGALVRYLPFLIAAAVLIFTIVDILLIDRLRVKGLPKIVWVLIVIALPIIGAVLWFLLGRERLSDMGQGGSFGPRPRRGPVAPDDDPDFLGKLGRDQAQEERIRDLERRLREIDDDDKPKE
ncbi:MAG: PLD nuclease N-terminal domain-containing protein [Pseudolysinimonas sp.]